MIGHCIVVSSRDYAIEPQLPNRSPGAGRWFCLTHECPVDIVFVVAKLDRIARCAHDALQETCALWVQKIALVVEGDVLPLFGEVTLLYEVQRARQALAYVDGKLKAQRESEIGKQQQDVCFVLAAQMLVQHIHLARKPE